MESFQTIAIFNYQHETVVLKHLLEQEEIPYFFENEMTLCSFDNSEGNQSNKVLIIDQKDKKVTITSIEVISLDENFSKLFCALMDIIFE